MTDAGHLPEGEPSDTDQALVALLPVIRKVVRARIRDRDTAEDLVQETVARLTAARTRVEPEMLPRYAAVTARNLVASYAEKRDRARSRAHLLAEADEAEPATQELLREEERSTVAVALANLPPADRDVLLAHEVEGEDTKSMAAARASTPGAVAAHLSRARARLRVEYLLASERVEPPSDRCRPVLLAISAGDRRRQRELDATGHLLSCDCCADIGARLPSRPATASACEARVPVSKDADVVTARQRGREVAAAVGFTGSDLTVIATAISEITRNIVKFADRGEILIREECANGRRGVVVVARDAGPGIPDPARAMEDGYSTYRGLGLGLPGARRLMDRLHLASKVGEGTTVTMEKWL